MILPFSTQLNGKPTYFVEKIITGLVFKNLISLNEANKRAEDTLIQKYNKQGKLESFLIKFNRTLTYLPKLHTIREDKNDRWQPGTKIDFFINCRQKNMFRFAPVLPVVSVQKIEIVYYSNRETIMNDLPPKRAVIIDDKKRLSDKEIQALAQNDGFDSLDDFFAYFENGFTGKLIHWTDLKY